MSWSSNATDWNWSGTLHRCQQTRMFFKKVGGRTEILNGWSQVKEVPVGPILMILEREHCEHELWLAKGK